MRNLLGLHPLHRPPTSPLTLGETHARQVFPLLEQTRQVRTLGRSLRTPPALLNFNITNVAVQVLVAV